MSTPIENLEITREDIEALQVEAAAAGDQAQAALCRDALDGDTDAWAECEEAILATVVLVATDRAAE